MLHLPAAGVRIFTSGFVSTNYTRGDEGVALAWGAEGAGPLQFVPPVSDA